MTETATEIRTAVKKSIAAAKYQIDTILNEEVKRELQSELDRIEKTDNNPEWQHKELFSLSERVVKERERVNAESKTNKSIIQNIHRETKTATPKPVDSLGDISAYCNESFSEKHNIDVEYLDMEKINEQNNEEIAIGKEADEIYQSGNALEYMINTCQKLHTGDNNSQLGMILSYAATRVKNSKGIHINLSGKAGSGKSHCVEIIIMILPKTATLNARVSDKALFRYEGMKQETVIVIDDQGMTTVLGEIYKNATTDWNTPTEYLVTDKNTGKAILLQIPIRCPFWSIKANLTGDEQTLDRQLKFEVKNDKKQLEAIRRLQNAAAINPDSKKDEHNILVCRKIWELIEHDTVCIPYANDIVCKDLEKTRTYNLMLELVNSFAILSAPKRARNDNGYIIASIEDFKNTCKILNSKSGAQNDNLGPEAKELLEYLRSLPSGDYFFKEIRDKFKISSVRLNYALHGRDKENPEIGGLCSLPQIGTRGSGRENIIEWNKELDLEVFGDDYSLFAMNEDRIQYWENEETKRIC